MTDGLPDEHYCDECGGKFPLAELILCDDCGTLLCDDCVYVINDGHYCAFCRKNHDDNNEQIQLA